MGIVSTPKGSIEIRQQLQDAVNTGYVLMPYHEVGVTHIEPWPPTTINYDPKGNPIPEPTEGRVVGTQDIDVAIFAAITGYMGPKVVVPPGSARIMQRINRFSNKKTPEISSLYSIAALSFAGKIALRNNEASGKLPTLVYWASPDQFNKRLGLFPFEALSPVAIKGAAEVTSEELSVNPYELPPVEAIDWGAQALAFGTFTQKTGL